MGSSTSAPVAASSTEETWLEVLSNTSLPNVTSSHRPEIDVRMYRYFLPPIMVFCIVSVVINITVLVVSYWIKRPLSPTLHISLSLAGADACTSLLMCVGLFVNSYLAIVFDAHAHDCLAMGIEVLRLSGVIVTVAHLLALAVNHYLGIIKPLHYISIMTHRNRTVCIALMWVLPIVFFVVYFSSMEGQGFQSPGCQGHQFLKEQKLRITYASLFFLPLVLMTVIYTHIFVIVQRHQRNRRNRFIRSQGSQYIRENGSRITRSPHQQRDLSMNIKAVKTTLLILGSFIVGLMPAVLSHVLVCDDCLVPLKALGNATSKFCVFYLVNFLVIFKTMLNPIIYAARMHEIKKATAMMKARLCRRCCCLLLRPEGDMEMSTGDISRHGQHRLSQYTDMSAHPRRSSTVVCRVRTAPYQTNLGNGSVRAKSQLTRSSTRSHQRHRTDLTLV